MKKLTLVITLFTALLAFNEISAQKFSGIDKSVADIAYYKTDRNAAPSIKVIYSRPLMKGRSVFGNLVPFEKVWRTGANEATEIRFYQDVMFGDKPVKAGTYTLYTIPGANDWTIILNNDTDVWGAYSYKEANDVARITVPVAQGNESLEAFSIAFKKEDDNKIDMVLGWDTTRVAIPFGL
ncbi:Protein of unknown function [Zhouia amylolytica]|uniref:Asparagine synthetase B n=2 Tax=Zhouia amylolytica TaxID=376730 RepID=W2US38_9FLAO|nr:DUF2911 domain-containing protein [Zhouia amylolytica]ETN96808.1 protein of unknown function (DUF2911) [Zhouia amylolytica AD3]MCQ0111156.1 DUF2911 domain-containing protein [Zhouia amylolytica]SFS95441.1 Protein of unknown function [Zhouia amylolytica]